MLVKVSPTVLLKQNNTKKKRNSAKEEKNYLLNPNEWAHLWRPKLWRPLKQPLGHRPCFLLLLPLVEWSTWKMMPLMRWLRTVIGNCDCDCIDPSAQRPLICHSCYLSCCWWGQKPLLLHSKKYMLTSNQSMALRYILCGLPSILSNNKVFYRDLLNIWIIY